MFKLLIILSIVIYTGCTSSVEYVGIPVLYDTVPLERSLAESRRLNREFYNFITQSPNPSPTPIQLINYNNANKSLNDLLLSSWVLNYTMKQD